MKTFTVEITVDDEISYRDIERTLNQLDADTELIEIEKVEDNV